MATTATDERGDRLVIFDGSVPQAQPNGFRNVEFNAYLDLLPDARIVTIGAGLPADVFSVGKPVERFESDLAGYVAAYPHNEGRITLLDPEASCEAELAYTVFLNETWTMLEYLERNAIPFAFCLYPGGGFFVDDEESDTKLKRIFSSPMFRRVLATQEFTRDYLLRKGLCSEHDITTHYGGFVQYVPEDVRPRRYFPSGKPTFDLAFVAARYMPRGMNKGYDLFLRTARTLCARHDDMLFHVVGNWDPAEIDVSDLGDRITFHGYLSAEELVELYTGIDVLLTPNRPLAFMKQFDGFPLGIDAGYCGVAVFTADELGMNRHYEEGEEIVRISLMPKEIAAVVERYYHEPEALRALAERGQARFQELFHRDEQIAARIAMFQTCLEDDRDRG